MKATIENAKKSGLKIGKCNGEYYWEHPRDAQYGRGENFPTEKMAVEDAAANFFDNELGWVF